MPPLKFNWLVMCRHREFGTRIIFSITLWKSSELFDWRYFVYLYICMLCFVFFFSKLCQRENNQRKMISSRYYQSIQSARLLKSSFHDMRLGIFYNILYFIVFIGIGTFFCSAVMYFRIPNDCFSVHLLSTYLHNISIDVWVMTYDLWYYDGWVIFSMSMVCIEKVKIALELAAIFFIKFFYFQKSYKL